MKTTAKIISLILSVLMIGTVAGCSKSTSISLGTSMSNSWGYRCGDIEVPVGVYINYLNVAYQDAQGKYEGEDMSLDSKIKDDDGKEVTVDEYTKAQAKKYCLEYIAYQLDAPELLGDKMYAQKDVDQYINDYFSQMESMYSMYGYSFTRDSAYSGVSQYGISKASYDASIAYDYYKDAIFKGLYATGGTQEVSNDELTKYFTDNYTHYRYVFASYKKSVDTDSSTDAETDIDGDAKKAYKDLFTEIADSTKSTEDFENGVLSYMKQYEITSDPTSARTEKLDDSSANEDVLKAVKELKSNKATVVEPEDGSGIYLVFKGDINDYVDFFTTNIDELVSSDADEASDTSSDTVEDTTDSAEDTSTDASTDNGQSTDGEAKPEYKINEVTSGMSKDTLLYEYKEEDFKKYTSDLVAKYEAKTEINEKEISKYDASMFITKK